ncbi:ATP-binding protein [Streptomyces sp. NPDC002018]|uniref:ATP-binding protein n=1 Tax=Streptomyces sp. NPDC002018 TaxID=3364629 RepID=UPI0036CDE6CA
MGVGHAAELVQTVPVVGNLPGEKTSFVGRRTELVLLEHALQEDRLITLTGIGGVGKTRLALRAARQAGHGGDGAPDGRGRFPDGVWWADLSPLHDERMLLTTVSDAVGLADHSLRMPIEALCEWLGDRRMLLVLDSCERMAPACAHLVAELLTAAPGLTVLTTSRAPLGAKGERLVDVPPLPVDDEDDEILQLFQDRAAVAAPRLRLDDPGTLASAVRICRRLEGIPLAVELACARLHDNSVERIAELLEVRLDARLDMLTHQDVWPQRHRALRTAIGWSHELCAPLERLLWARLSVFRGDMDEYDIREVCAGGPLTTAGVTRALDGLVAQSVLRRDGARYRMLDTIREYGAMWLAELGEEKQLADRHAAHFAALVRQAHTGWIGPDQSGWYRRISDAHADLCATLDHLLVHDPATAVETAGRIGFFWNCCRHLHEARIYLERALDASPAPGPHRTRALTAFGIALVLQGDHEGAYRLGEQCTLAAWHDQDPESALFAAYLLSLSCLMLGRARAAHTVADRALRAHPGGPFDSPSQLMCRLALVFSLTALGRLDESRARADELRRLCQEHGECWTGAYADYQLALVHLLQGRPHEAEAHARSMVRGKEQLGDSFGIALGLDLLAAAVAAQGDGERAAYAYGTGQAFWRMVGHPQRGTPELGPVRAECERQARAAAGNPAYEEAFHRGLVADGESGLARALHGRPPLEPGA